MTPEELQRLINKKAMGTAQTTLGIQFGDIRTRAELVNGSTYVSGFLECAKLVTPLIKALELASSFKNMDDCNGQAGEICKEALENFEKELK